VETAKQYNTFKDHEKRRLLSILYNDHGLSWQVIGEMTGTYSNKVRRDAKRLEIVSRSKSEAQKVALQSNRHPHPTKDKGHSAETKIKISDAVALDWSEMQEDERADRQKTAKEIWDNKTPDEIRDFRAAAGKGVRKAAKEGSALEKYLLTGLIEAGHKVEFHKEQWVSRERLQIDLHLPLLNVAIEVDGPSHHEDIWGEEALRKNKERDAHKSGLLLERGACIIRIRQTQSLSSKYKRTVLKTLLTKLEDIKTSFPPKGERLITFGD
jgi:very-short-patch-repair endonuclease